MTDEYLNMLRTQTLYLINFKTDIMIKSVPNDGYFMKTHGKEIRTS